MKVCRSPDGSEAEGHEQQDGHDTHGSLVARRVAALKTKRETSAARTQYALSIIRFYRFNVALSLHIELFPPVSTCCC